MLASMVKSEGGRPKTRDTVSHVKTAPLADMDIARKQSSRWQQQANVPDEKFEAHVATVSEANEELTSAS